jgi:hypothetical protein
MSATRGPGETLIFSTGTIVPDRERFYPCPRRACDDAIVAARIRYDESDLRERAKRLGAVWRPAQKLWEMHWIDAKRLAVADRVAEP